MSVNREHGEHSKQTPSRKPERRAVAERLVQRVTAADSGSSEPTPDAIAVEEPLELRIAGDTLATIMRTPGEDRYLVAGFLYGDGMIHDLADLGRIAHCGRPTATDYGNLIDVAPGPGTALAPELTRYAERGNLVGSACGVCGRERIDDLIERLGHIDNDVRVKAGLIVRAVTQLQARQSGFAHTGAMHGALALGADGTELAVSEDVGRHNAVDKVIGKLLYAGVLAADTTRAALLVVSGRTSFEIVQKAAMARFAAVVSVSAPTSLAIDLAVKTGITLAGFARGATFNLYSCPQRIDFD